MESAIVGSILSWLLGIVTKLHNKHLAAVAAKADLQTRTDEAKETSAVNDQGTANTQAAEQLKDETVQTLHTDADSVTDVSSGSDIAGELRNSESAIDDQIAAANNVQSTPTVAKPAKPPQYFSS